MNSLRPYQEEDKNFLASLNSGACFNEQRTGKTPTLLSVVRERKIQKVLIVCPKSGVEVWHQHWNDWVQTPCIIVVGTRTQKENNIAAWKTGALIIGYDSLKETKTCAGFIDEIKSKAPNCVILDEAHRINGRTTATAKAIFKFKRVPIKYVATGTPTKGKAHHIWSILHFLYPDFFRSYWRFIRRYFKTWTISGRGHGKAVTQIGSFKYGMEKKLWSILQSFSTQRKRIDVMSWLPTIEETTIYLEPTKQQLKHLNNLKRWFRTESLSVPNTISSLIRIRQICLHPCILGLQSGIPGPKDQWILTYLNDYPEQQILIFSKFRTYLDHLEKLLLPKTNVGYLHGGMGTQHIQEISQSFQSGKLNTLLIQIDVGKEALTLDAADTIIFTDKYPPVGDIDQAKDRFVATTPDKAHQTKIIYNLVMRGTYEEKIIKMLAERKSEIDLINDFKRRMLDDINNANRRKAGTG